jgi:hypothetical protein
MRVQQRYDGGRGCAAAKGAAGGQLHANRKVTAAHATRPPSPPALLPSSRFVCNARDLYLFLPQEQEQIIPFFFYLFINK